MKKSEMKISMPLTAYEEYEKIKNEYAELKVNLSKCFEKDTNGMINFDVKKCLSVTKNYMQFQDKTKDIKILI